MFVLRWCRHKIFIADLIWLVDIWGNFGSGPNCRKWRRTENIYGHYFQYDDGQ